ncbi:hypothetical protein NDR87_36200 [Nocardia sp. CDC159]|uniref:SnoaL-like domain-containing protein n=1 Tax=Nocardia pulmonis TaxID=2951408 RepID=A0A9X2J091_9NOCA|nr:MULTISPECIES: hypothetical protein [Nocardia]MCM6778927.1 hypothetical protein [Nocardia pulmonis]MCM6791820.1 hypothetical protein [Nocardia sp. CDC159]
MDRREYDEYLAMYNAGEYRQMAERFFDRNIRFIVRGTITADGYEETIESLEKYHATVREILTVESFEADTDGTRIHVHLVERSEATGDSKSFAAPSLRAGDTRADELEVDYTLENGKFTEINITALRNIELSRARGAA